MSTDVKIMPDETRKYRLITRSDMDGLVCAIILKSLDLIDDILFVHPKDMQDGLIEVSENDISTNLPYVEGIYLCFDHHASEAERMEEAHPDNHVIEPDTPSAARVVYNYFGGKDNPKLSNIQDDMMEAVDKADAAQFSKEDILNPQGWELLSFIMDARTGLGRFRDFNISNYELMMKLIDYIPDHHNIDDVLNIPDVKERVELYNEHKIKFRGQIESCAQIYSNVVVIDLRHEQNIWAGNRFVVYALFPQCNVSVHCIWGKNKQNTVFAVGKSIMNRTSRAHVGQIMLEYGGGGHHAAGTCQVDNLKADQSLDEIVKRLISES